MKYIMILAMALTVVSAGAQTFIPMKKGAVLEYKYYDAKDRPVRNEWREEKWLRFTVEEVWGDTVANVVIENEYMARYAAANEPLKRTVSEMSYGDVIVNKDGVTFDNMRWLFQQIPNMFDYYSVRHDGKNMTNGFFCSDGESYYRPDLSSTSHLPRELHVGDKLPDEQYSVRFIEELSEQQKEGRKDLQEWLVTDFNVDAPSPSINIEDRASIVNRYVDGFENVSVPAGEFGCWKITYDLVKPETGYTGIPEDQLLKEGLITGTTPLTTKYIDYLSPEVGLVKREKMNFRGNRVEETMVLESIK